MSIYIIAIILIFVNVFARNFGGGEGNLLREHATGMFFYAFLRFDSHVPKTKKPPNGGFFVLVENVGIEPMTS